MLTVYSVREGRLVGEPHNPEQPLPEGTLWIDLLHPSLEEERIAEEAIAVDIPSLEDMQEIEASSRLYRVDGALVMTATVVDHAETDEPRNEAVTFILTDTTLVTLRYAEPLPFRMFPGHLQRDPLHHRSGRTILVGLLETMIDRLADILEYAGTGIDSISQRTFRTETSRYRRKNLEELLHDVGRKGELTSKAQESLFTFTRLLGFLRTGLTAPIGRETNTRLKTLIRDAQSLTHHAAFLSNKVNFMLDAILGMINIEQNSIIKIFSVAAVVFLPPTLVASIYGMNFKHMPELNWMAGYPFALGLMVVCAVLPYWYFKRKGWL